MANIRKKVNKSGGFTLIELMIAVMIFGFLTLYVSQLMSSEIKLYNSASKRNDLDHNARTAMMHILDEMRLKHSKIYYNGDGAGVNSGVYYYPTATSTTKVCLINQKPSLDLSRKPTTPGTVIFFDELERELWYREYRGGNIFDHLISDQIQSLELSEEGPKLLKIVLKAEDTSIHKTYELVSYMRLY